MGAKVDILFQTTKYFPYFLAFFPCSFYRTLNIPPLFFQKTRIYESCTRLDDVVQIECETDGQGYDADGQRYGQFDDHEEQHCQATADADHVVHEAREY